MRISECTEEVKAVSGYHFGASSLHEIFHARALEFPERIAASDDQRKLTYAELDKLSSRLAFKLRQQGVVAGTLVGLYMERGVEMLTGLLGILKAGGAYLPIDPTYPKKRIEHILEDSLVEAIICTSKNSGQIRSGAVRPVLIDELWAELTEDLAGSDDYVAESAAADELAYVIYTSGSTGKPKGVMVEHGNVIRLFEQTQAWFGFGEFDVWSMFHSIGFDFSVWEIWGALLYGGQVVIVPYAVSRSPASFHQWLLRHGVTVVNQTPSAFRNLDAADRIASEKLALRYVIFGGEMLPLVILQHWVDRHGDETPALINMYGITETTVHVSYKRVRGSDLQGATASPIGAPIPDFHLHLLDEHQKPVPDGVAGELYVEGPGVARGYLNQAALTAERFVQLHSERSGELVRAYRSGDIAVRGADGQFSYLGRTDEQLKIRGFRIESGEVEACLLRRSYIGACHVGSHDYGDGDVRLVAYIVPTGEATIWTDEVDAGLKREISLELPDYMRPSAHVVLQTLPLTEHGKIDKQALPSPETNAWGRHVSAEASLSEEEACVLGVWRDRLGLKGIGLHDDFFDSGGTSLALIRSLSEIRARYKINLDLGILSERATAKVLADYIRVSLAKDN